MRDPFLRHVVQPLVDAIGFDPRPAALQAATGFVAAAVTVSALRVIAYGSEVHFSQTLHLVGALMMFWWMRWAIRNGGVARIGGPGAMHVILRWMLLVCTALDVAMLARILGEAHTFLPGAITRTLMATLEDGLGAAALFLSACDMPPPRRRRQPITA